MRTSAQGEQRESQQDGGSSSLKRHTTTGLSSKGDWNHERQHTHENKGSTNTLMHCEISASSGLSVPSINAELFSKLTEQLVNR